MLLCLRGKGLDLDPHWCWWCGDEEREQEYETFQPSREFGLAILLALFVSVWLRWLPPPSASTLSSCSVQIVSSTNDDNDYKVGWGCLLLKAKSWLSIQLTCHEPERILEQAQSQPDQASGEGDNALNDVLPKIQQRVEYSQHSVEQRQSNARN